LNKIRRMAAQLLKVGNGKVWLNPDEREKIASVMTKEDVRELIKNGLIKKKKTNEKSRGRTRILGRKKKLGRKKGHGKRKGKGSARAKKKRRWIANVRAQRSTLRMLKKKDEKAVKKAGYSKIYKRIMGGFFKGKRYVEEAVKGKAGR